ncbi:hypothetical protein [Gelidibacter mesophilus]|uniref:hypothetical protein n=1 Tax=Gelidibacter mesophilus TaxID=169050 RepID=UPI0004034719|nr:hypothetical protein [Gelidibacter mesophilus]
MEKSKVKKQNNRQEDEKRNPDSKNNAPSKEKEWDPDPNERDEESRTDEKLENLKGVRKPKDEDN